MNYQKFQVKLFFVTYLINIHHQSKSLLCEHNNINSIHD